MATLYNVVSADGFIASKDGREDFIPDATWSQTLTLFQNYDAIVMGRKTYEALQKYEKALIEPFENLSIRKIVITNNPEFHPKQGYKAARTPEEALRSGSNVLVTSGPTLNEYLLQKGLVDKILLREIPAILGEGIPPFKAVPSGVEIVKVY